MNIFDNSEYEVRQHWGDTDAYKESKQKTAGYSADKWNEVIVDLNTILAKVTVALKDGATPESETAQLLVKKLQQYITDNFYIHQRNSRRSRTDVRSR